VSNEDARILVSERRRFRDFEQLAEAARDWDLKLQQIGTGSFWGRLDQVVTKQVRLGRARFGQRLIQEGGSPAGMVTFCIPVEGSEAFDWRNRWVTPDMVGVFPPDGEFRSVSGPGFDVYPLSVQCDHLVKVAADVGLPAVPVLIGERGILSPASGALGALRDHLARLLRLVPRPDDMGGRSIVERETTELLLAAIADSKMSKRPRARLRDRALRQAELVIEAAGRHPIQVSDVCRASGSSWRTLNYAFREKYGTTVEWYMKARRLNGLRRDLQQPDPTTTTISEVAAGWGFWHMGMLAADYRRLFGELPSETLKGKPNS